MPKKAKELSALEVKNIKKLGLHAVGGVAGSSEERRVGKEC